MSYVAASIKSYPFFWNNSFVIGHSSSVCLTDRIFLQRHVTFCEYLVFREFKIKLKIKIKQHKRHAHTLTHSNTLIVYSKHIVMIVLKLSHTFWHIYLTYHPYFHSIHPSLSNPYRDVLSYSHPLPTPLPSDGKEEKKRKREEKKREKRRRRKNSRHPYSIGRFSEAGLLEWMRFVIFRARSREWSQRTSGSISE